MKKTIVVAGILLSLSGIGCATIPEMIQEQIGEEHAAPTTPEVERIRGEGATAGEDTLCCRTSHLPAAPTAGRMPATWGPRP